MPQHTASLDDLTLGKGQYLVGKNENSGLALRLAEHGEENAPVSIRRFDPTNSSHVDEAALYLFERFRSKNDSGAFQLLFEVTQQRLSEMARQLVRRLSTTLDPDDLVANFMARLFCNVGNDSKWKIRHFLAFARVSIRNEILDHLRHQKRVRHHAPEYELSRLSPIDPADAAQSKEQGLLIEDLGEQVLELTSECFDELSQRDQQVLIAREIVGLSYERVASLLSLLPDQIGMIIRRARMHLADRLVFQLNALAPSKGRGTEEMAVLQEHVLRPLGGPAKTRSARILLARMLEVAVLQANQTLADLLYEMTKSCLAGQPSFQSQTLINAPPRHVKEVSHDLQCVETRLRSMPRGLKISGLGQQQPHEDPTLEDARRCLDALHTIEGPSGRQQVAVGLLAIHSGDPCRAEAIFRELKERVLPMATRQNVSRNLAMSLLRQERYADALQIADEGEGEWPDDPVRVMNTAYATARLGDIPRFESTARHLAEIQRKSPSLQLASWIRGPLARLAQDLGFSPDRVETLTHLKVTSEAEA